MIVTYENMRFATNFYLKEAVLDLEAYATRELQQLPSYLEAIKECCEEMLQSASTPVLRKELSKQAAVWRDCVNLKFAIKGVSASKKSAKSKYVKKSSKFFENLMKDEKKEEYTHFAENLFGQQRQRESVLLKMLLESGSEGDELIGLATGNGMLQYF
jgi:hypothetical protein